MKTHQTIAGNNYVVYSKNGGTVTDASGTLNKTVEAGDFLFIPAAPSDMLMCDDDESVIKQANFKRASLAIRLLGGGNKGLPAGYTRADFLESTGGGRVNLLQLNEPYDTETIGFYAESTFTKTEVEGYPITLWGTNGGKGLWYVKGVGKSRNYDDSISGQYFLRSAYLGIIPIGNRVIGGINFLADKFHWAKGGGKEFKRSLTDYDTVNVTSGASVYVMMDSPYVLHHRIKISQGNVITRDFIPTLAPNGAPCMYDLVARKPFYNSGSGRFIVGLTLSQAAQLGRKLPSAGGSLTLSLPEGYDMDERVVNSLAEAEAKGWVLTLQTYAAEMASATFALRRVWVRRVQAENGTYVDAEGTRWQVEWCVDIIGAAPESLGYERFRSVDAAVAYWELAPWVDPEEELSTIE